MGGGVRAKDRQGHKHRNIRWRFRNGADGGPPFASWSGVGRGLGHLCVGIPVLIGSVVAVLITIFGPLTGCGMNPARDLGPRLVSFAAGWGSVAWSHWWIYTLGPVVGAVLGGAFYTFAFKPLQPGRDSD